MRAGARRQLAIAMHTAGMSAGRTPRIWPAAGDLACPVRVGDCLPWIRSSS
jgi:hypothetical protein